MARADELRALAEEVDRYDDLHTAYVTAQDAVRANPDDVDAAAQYRAAKYALDGHRATVRQGENRSGVSFGTDMIRTEG